MIARRSRTGTTWPTPTHERGHDPARGRARDAALPVLSANRPIPRDKDLLRDLETLAAPLGALGGRFYGAETFAGRRVLAVRSRTP